MNSGQIIYCIGSSKDCEKNKEINKLEHDIIDTILFKKLLYQLSFIWKPT